MKTKLLLVGLTFVICLPLSAQVFKLDPASGGNFPHFMAGLQKHLSVMTEAAPQGAAEHWVVSFIIPVNAQPQSFPGNIFVGKYDKYGQAWNTQLPSLAMALSKPLKSSKKPQSISWIDPLPSDIHKKIGISPSYQSWKPKSIIGDVGKGKGKVSATLPGIGKLIDQKAPSDSQYALVVCMVDSIETQMLQPQSTMLVFF